MPVLMIADASGDKMAHYDRVTEQLRESGNAHPPGRQFHVAAEKGTGYVISDVWESQEALDRFMQIVGPLLQQAGSSFDGQMTQVLPVHNMTRPD